MDDVPVWSISPNPTVMYLTPLLKAGIARVKRAIERKQGLCMVVGDIGLGKSTLLRYISANYDMDETRYSTSYLHDSRKCKSPFDLLKMISEDFGIPPKRSQMAQMGAIEAFLESNYAAGKTTVIFIDEGQRLPLETLELIRSLLNYETDTHKLVQFVVAGQNNLRDRLLTPRYNALRSRIVAPIVMQPLTMEETKNMIQSRVESWDMANPFSPEALNAIYALSGGVPREILLLCQHSYDMVVSGDKILRPVSDEDVREAHRTLSIADPSPLEMPEVPEYEPVS